MAAALRIRSDATRPTVGHRMIRVVGGSRTRMICNDHRRTAGYQRAVLRHATTGLGARLDAPFEYWTHNFMSDLYTAKVDGTPVVLKIVVGKPAETALAQFSSLVELQTVLQPVPSIAVPSPVMELTDRSSYIMERVSGRLLQKLHSTP